MIVVDDAEFPKETPDEVINKQIAFAIGFYKRQAEDCLAVMNLILAEVDQLKSDCGDAYKVIDYLTDKLGVFDENKTFPLENLMAAQEGQVRPHVIGSYPRVIEGTVSKL